MKTTVRNEAVPRRSTPGFSLLELIVVLLVGSVAIGIMVRTFSDFQESTTARRAAEVFVRDLSTARAAAVRQREPVAVTFAGGTPGYRVRSGDQVFVTRDFGPGGEIGLSETLLDLPGDSVVFTARGMADFDGGAPVATASFRAGSNTYVVSFNALATAEVAPLD